MSRACVRLSPSPTGHCCSGGGAVGGAAGGGGDGGGTEHWNVFQSPYPAAAHAVLAESESWVCRLWQALSALA